MTPDEFRVFGHALVDWIAEYRSNLPKLRVMSDRKPGEIRALLPTQPPSEPEPMESLLADLRRVVLPGMTHWSHPSFFAYFPSNSSLPSVLADLVASGLGAQSMSWQTSPAATELEEVMMDWLRRMVGLPETFTGVLQDTASTSTLVALICARERTSRLAQMKQGLQASHPAMTVYASEQAHSSVEKAVRLAGFGLSNLRLIETDSEFALVPQKLEQAISADLDVGKLPSAVVATVGTTATVAVDPVEAIAQIAARHRLWLHVDAAMAGTAMLLPECRRLWQGVEAADSLVFNPHKWMGATFDCSTYFVRDPGHLVQVMSTHPSYLKTGQDAQVKNFRDWGIPLGRRFRALKLWFLIREQGVRALQARIRRDLSNARWLAEQVDASPDWERVAPVLLQTVSLRHRPAGMQDDQLNPHNLALAERVNRSGAAYLTTALVGGRQILRLSIGSETTEREDVQAVWSLLNRQAQVLL